jgi:hypothetical protein
MSLHNPVTVLLLGVFMVGFLAGVVFAGFIFALETRKWRKRERVWIGSDPARADGVMHIDHVEFPAPHA